MHFLEAMEREIDFRHEYHKLEEMISGEQYYLRNYQRIMTINDWVESEFRKWKKRENYTSFQEVREQLGFPGVCDELDDYPTFCCLDINHFFLFCEMFINIVKGLDDYLSREIEEPIQFIIETMQVDIEKCGFEIKENKGEFIIVEKNAAALEVADAKPDLAERVIEYNHYLLRGNLKRKQEILRDLADALEPERKKLEALIKTEVSDFFYLVNNMNIRHNNCDERDLKKYNESFAALDENEQEKWYDMIYDEALILFMYLDQPDRRKAIESFKNS